MKAKPEFREYLSDSERQNIVRVSERRKEGIGLIGNHIGEAILLVGYECEMEHDSEFERTTNVLVEQLEIENGEIVKPIPPTHIDIDGNDEILKSKFHNSWVALHIQLERIFEELMEQYKYLARVQKRVKHRSKVIPFPIKKRTGKLEEVL